MTELLPLNTSHLPVRLTVDDYLLLDRAGAFADYAKTELIEGEILYVNAQHRPHARIKSRFFRVLSERLDAIGGMEAIVEGAIGIPPHSSPEPDIVVTDDPEGAGLIPLESVRLVIEVSDTTINFDTVRKLELYARFGIADIGWSTSTPGWFSSIWRPTGAPIASG
jgi:Uma2 family endonuclease